VKAETSIQSKYREPNGCVQPNIADYSTDEFFQTTTFFKPIMSPLCANAGKLQTQWGANEQ